MQIEREPLVIPKRCYQAVTKLPSSEFHSICNDLREFGEAMQVTASEEGITFSVEGNLVSGRVFLRPRAGDKPNDKVALRILEPVTATFALSYLVNFSKAAELCSTVELSLGPDAPLRVKYDIKHGYLQFFLAPIV